MQVNDPPQADAGADQSVLEGTTNTLNITLSGVNSFDVDDSIDSVLWTQISPTDPLLQATIHSNTSITTRVELPFAVTESVDFVFQLTASDGLGGVGTDTVSVLLVRDIAGALEFDQNLMGANMIFGTSPVADGHWTTDRRNNIELALRARKRPTNIIYSLGAGRYVYGNVASGLAEFNVDISVSTNAAGPGVIPTLDRFRYKFQVDEDPAIGVFAPWDAAADNFTDDFLNFNPLVISRLDNSTGATASSLPLPTYAFAHNRTSPFPGVQAPAGLGPYSAYLDLLTSSGVVQESSNPVFLTPLGFTFNVTAVGGYTVNLCAFDTFGTELARTVIEVFVGPDPVIAHNVLTISEGATVTISPAELRALDPSLAPSSQGGLLFHVTALAHGEFLKGGVSVLTFSQDDVEQGLITFQHDGGELPPSYTITAEDPVDFGLSAPVPVTVTYTPVSSVDSSHLRPSPTVTTGERCAHHHWSRRLEQSRLR